MIADTDDVATRQNLRSLLLRGFVDKRVGELKYRLLGIAPVAPDVSTLSQGPEAMKNALVPLFWIWFPDATTHLTRLL